ncbi:MAG TPA: ParB N-terminal domain-containing protein [Chloroflexia bacterium]|nr:ParB N-terminal domain-containing protein [Chloroflexia bacterium]
MTRSVPPAPLPAPPVIPAPALGGAFGLPDLRIVPLAEIVPHEQADPRRVARLSRRIAADNLLKNPVIVTPIPGSSRYMVMDGANRTAALGQVGARDVLAQIVHYDQPGVQLTTWHHLITGLPPNALLEAIAALPGLALAAGTPQEARAALAARQAVAYLVHPPHDDRAVAVYLLTAPQCDARTETGLLLEIVDLYKGKPETAIHRVGSDDIAEYLDHYDDISALIVFPPYQPSEILELARDGLRVPTGITRHIIPARALRVNVPLDVLRDPHTSLAEKNAWWHDHVKGKLADNEIRFYQESTYLFDE